ncbi:MAG: iron ABC transporter permease [Thermotogota bacterium]|nr:iron ABC transporter permease [Thermotogota bacterium]
MIELFTKKKVAVFIVLLVLVLILDFWIFNNVKDEFADIIQSNRAELASALLLSAPTDEEKIEGWLATNREKHPDLNIIYIKGLPGYGDSKLFTVEEGLLRFYSSNEDSAVFEKGIESAVYDELYFAQDNYNYRDSENRLVFAPIKDEMGFPVGVGIFLFNNKEYKKFNNLINIFILAVAAIFFVVYWLSQFTRDPMLSFIILFLLLLVGIFIVYPLFEAVRLTFLKDGQFSLETWKTILTTKQYVSALWGSIKLGISTATFSTLVGFLFAFVITRTAVKGKKFFSTMATLPVISPPFSLTLSIILLFGNNGLITKQLLNVQNFSIYGLGGLTLVQTMGMFPIAFLTMVGVLNAIDSTLEDAAMDLSASRMKTFTSVTLPLAVPGILSAWLLVFTNSLADFANPLILSGDYRVLSVEAYLEVTGMNRLGNGAALSLLLLLPTLTAFLVQRTWVSKKSYVTVTGKPSATLTELTSKPVKYTLLTLMIVITAFLIGLYGTIVAGCFVKNWGIDYSFTLENWSEALQRGKDAIVDTTILATITMPIAGIIAMVAAMIIVRKKFYGKRLMEILLMTPFAIPGTLIGISFILAFNKAPLILVGTAAIIIINYVVRELPVGIEGGVATLRQIDPAIEEAASDLGADVPTVFRTIILPLIRPAFISSLSYTFVRSMTAVSAVIFLISAQWYHMTVLIYNFSENLRFGLASVLATTLIIIVLAVFGLMRLLIRENKVLAKNDAVMRG